MLYSTFVPRNPRTNHLADFGDSRIQTTFKHTVAGNATVDVVVNSLTSVFTDLGAYRLVVYGLTPLEYSANNGATWQTSNTFNNLSPGSYNIVSRSALTNANTCPVSLSSNPVTLSIQGSSVGGTVSSNATICSECKHSRIGNFDIERTNRKCGSLGIFNGWFCEQYCSNRKYNQYV